ncbi:PDZ and LIM domain protein 7 [Crotalus adamanteus]|uniref:PDZ and LIM domain protein 7 n=1 Tax=Crotalus adamanteus TaxID=8729 RepID=A0AAW1BVG4_CROAD
MPDLPSAPVLTVEPEYGSTAPKPAPITGPSSRPPWAVDPSFAERYAPDKTSTVLSTHSQPATPTPVQNRNSIVQAAQQAPESASKTPICYQCNKIIRGRYLMALGRYYHPEEFTCSQCRKMLDEGGFFEEKGSIFCPKCYDMRFAPNCAKCKKKITGEIMHALKMTWHVQCFVCAACRTPIRNRAFYIEEGQPYCERDYDKMFGTKCRGCDFKIDAGDRFLEALGFSWHDTCFVCAICQINLEGKTFYSKKDKPLCKSHAFSHVVGREGQVRSLSCWPDLLAKAVRDARWPIPRTHVWRNREAAVSGAEETGQGREGEPVYPALGPSAHTGGASSAPRPPGSLAAAAVSPRQAGRRPVLSERGSGTALCSRKQHPSDGAGMAGVSFSANRLELLASYQEVIGEDSPTDCPEDDQGNSAPPTGKMFLNVGRAGGRSRRKKPLATPSGALATPLAGRVGAELKKTPLTTASRLGEGSAQEAFALWAVGHQFNYREERLLTGKQKSAERGRNCRGGGLRARTDKGSASALLWRGGAGGGDAGRERAPSHLPSCDLRQKLVRVRISGRGNLRRGGSGEDVGAWGQNVYSLDVQSWESHVAALYVKTERARRGA